MFTFFFNPNLAGITDVLLTSPTDGQGLIYHAASGKWINGSPTATLASIADQRLLGNVSGGSAVPTALTQAQTRTFLGLASVATSGSAADLGTGTLPDARFPATLPAASGANLTNLPAANITGFLPTANLSPSDGGATVATMANGTILASDGTLYKRLGNSGTAAVLGGASGGLEFYSTLPAVSGVNLTDLNAANLGSGTVPTARLGSGTANNTTYLRGDSTWATVSAGIGGTLGTIDNTVPRADGTGGVTAQGSDITILDAATATTNNVAIANVHAGQTNSSLVLSPKGNGAIICGPRPDSLSTGGNLRGSNAIDLQTLRSSAAQVASGTNSLVAGAYNTASGNSSSAIGVLCVASALASNAAGYRATASHSGAYVIGADYDQAVSSDRSDQFKVRCDGGITHQNDTGTSTNWGKRASAPVTGINAGDIYYDTVANKHYGYDGGAWNAFW